MGQKSMPGSLSFLNRPTTGTTRACFIFTRNAIVPNQLEQRATDQRWYELQQPQFAYVSYLEQPKIVFPDIATGCRFALDTKRRFGANTVYFIPLADHALLGLLNSRLAHFFFKQTCAALEGPGEAYLRFFGQYLEGFPVRLPEAPQK